MSPLPRLLVAAALLSAACLGSAGPAPQAVLPRPRRAAHLHQYHGIVIVRLVDGLIANWREYQVRSDLPWDRFMDDNAF